jgi:hypothetical protein
MLPTALLGHLAKARFLLDQHASTILTGMGVAGTVSTAVLTGRSTVKAVREIDASERMKMSAYLAEHSTIESGHKFLSTTDKLRLIWPLYIPPAITGITTIMAIVSANRIDSKKIAALTVAAGVSDRTLQEYKTKLEEKLTARQYANVKDEIANDHVQATPAPSGTVIIADGKVLCFDDVTGRYFYSTAEEIKRAENKLNHEILNSGGASLSEFHDDLGLESTSYTSMVGWGPDNLVEVEFHSALKDGKPVLAINFNYPPTAAYLKLH